jgi:exopolyphosphatase/guanosine-5'-triphosphate,3'-diphosphate pyrophosphatase
VKALYLIVLLRLAVLLHRGRGPRAAPDVRLQVQGKGAQLEFPRGWLAEHPLTQVDLEQEADYLAAAGFKLKIA